MSIPLSIPWDMCIGNVFPWLGEKVAYIHHLEKNLDDLERAVGELKAKRADLQGKVTGEEERGQQVLEEIKVWLTNSEAIIIESDELLRTRDAELQRLCLCEFFSTRLISSYRYGKKVSLALQEADERHKKDFSRVVVEQSQTSVVQEIQLPRVIVGQETMLEKAWKHLKEEEVSMIGMYGMGGVGKTTLLKQLNNKCSEEMCGFNFVLWVVVSKELNLDKIQDEIAHKVGLGAKEWKQKEKSEKVGVIYNFLRKKKFVLFLDDIWEEVNLAEIGVPLPTRENKCKVVFTTRSRNVCAHMEVEKLMEVKCLTDKEAFDLFQKKVGERTLRSDPEIRELARTVAGKCRGLPLALNIIGETMSCKTNIHEWHHAIGILNKYAREFSDMENKILPLLKYSYDDLKGKEMKSCLLYCALFPEDYKIFKESLIDYWIGEGMIDGSESTELTIYKGYGIIGDLVRASLLMEEFDSKGNDCVYMHDVVREMALWIASELGKQKDAFIVHAGVGLRGLPKVKNWSTVRKMSLMENEIGHLVGSPECLELKTLLLQKTNLVKISGEFFKSMPKLAVLDLSENRDLNELTWEISELVSLRYLNLSYIGSHFLLLGFKSPFSLAGISNLRKLKVLKLHRSSLSLDIKTVEELETLDHLEVLTLQIVSDLPSLERYLNSHRLVSCTRELTIRDISSGSISLPVTMAQLHTFTIHAGSISEIRMVYSPRNQCFSSLSKVHIFLCDFLRELTLLMFAPNLKYLNVEYARQLEDIINEEKACEDGDSEIVPFRKLISLRLEGLSELKSIYWRPLPFPCLKEITILQCPNLKKLPLDSQSGMIGENERTIIFGDEEWIEGLEWKDEATKTRFSSSHAKKKWQSMTTTALMRRTTRTRLRKRPVRWLLP